MKKLRIMSYGDDPLTSTGYGQIWENLLNRWVKLRPDWEFMHVGWQQGDRIHDTKEGYKLLPGNLSEYGYVTVYPYLIKFKPDILVTCCDVGIQAGYVEHIQKAKKEGWNGLWIAYTPLDTHTWEYVLWDKIFEMPDVNVAMSQFGLDVMKEHKVRNATYIKFGAELDKFKPLPNRDQLRKRNEIHDKFVVGFVGRNQRRKMINQLIKAFSQFSKGKDDVKLLLHTEQSTKEGWNLPNVVALYNEIYDHELVSKKKVMFTFDNMHWVARQAITPEKVNEFYNMMDVFGYATGGEGAGMPGIECQAAGVPLIMNDCSSAKELTGNGEHGYLVTSLLDKYERPVIDMGPNGVDNRVPDDVLFAAALDYYYSDWKSDKLELNTMSKKGLEFAKAYNWDGISNDWINLFEKHAE